ncbi:MAG: MarR family winged helix-turn-helix transcriptional regulator [Coriobacteriales bacterium]
MTTADLSIGSRLDWINHFIKLNNCIDKNVRDSCGLNITQSRILFYVGTHESHPIGNVGTSLFLKPSTITAAVNHMVDDGFISRSYDDLDRRNVYINITQKGIDITPNFIPAVTKGFEKDCTYPPSNRDELLQLLLPASSHVFFDTDEEDISSIATRIARDLNLDHSQEEVILHITRVLIIESISFFLSKMTEYERSIDLSPNEARILHVLGNNNKGMRLKDLSAFIDIRPNVASLSIRTLTDRNLINRACNNKDRRAASVTLSRKGARFVRDTNAELCEIFDSCFPDLSEHEFSEFFQAEVKA